MKIIDLSVEIYQGMPVYPGDPEVEMKLIQTFEKDSWNLTRVSMNLHDGTHINFPIHAMSDGKSSDDYKLDDFIGETYLYKNSDSIKPGFGILFNENLTMDLAKEIVEKKPKFVGTWDKDDVDVDVERFLLEHDILLFERLLNLNELPEKFIFHAVPLNFRAVDGSPVRAYAIID